MSKRILTDSTIDGTLSVTESISATTYYGDGSNLSGISSVGGVQVSGTPTLNQLAIWVDDNTIKGDSTLQSTISTNTNDISTLTTNVGTISGNVDTITTDITTITGNIDTINTTITTISGNIDDIVNDIVTVNNDINTINTTITTISGNIDDIVNDIIIITDDINAINSSTDATTTSEAKFLVKQKEVNSWSITEFDYDDTITDGFTDTVGVSSYTNIEFITGGYFGTYPNATMILQTTSDTNGDTNILDRSINAFTIVNGDGVGYDTSDAKFGTSSIYFPGNKGMSVNLGSALLKPNADNKFTFDGWFKPITDATGRYIFTTAQNIDGEMEWGMYTVSGDLYIEFYPTGLYSSRVTYYHPSFFTGGWDYVKVTHDGLKYRLFKNGAQIDEQTVGIGTTTIYTSYNIGRAPGGATVSAYRGFLEEYRILTGIADNTLTVPTSPINTGYTNAVITSTTKNALSVPTRAVGSIVIEGTLTYNTDITMEVSRDGGTTWTAMTLSYISDWLTNQKYLLTSATDISSQPSGTSMVYRISTFNNSVVKIHNSFLRWY